MSIDQILLLNAFPIACQAILKGISVQAVCMEYLLVLVAECYCDIHVDGKYNIWTILYTFMFLNIILELESRSRFNTFSLEVLEFLQGFNALQSIIQGQPSIIISQIN